MTTRKISVGVLAVVLGILIATASIVAAGSKVTGTLYSLATKNHTVTLKNSSGGLQTLNVAKAKMKRNGATTTLTGLVIGDKVSAGFLSGGMNPNKLQAKGHKVTTVAGALQGVSSSSASVQVAGKSLKTNARSHVLRNGAIIPLSKLTKRDSVTVHVNSSNECDDIDSEGPDDSEVSGTIASVDTTAGTITITPDDGSPDITLTVTVDTEIELGDDDALLSNLIAGDTVEAEYDPTTLVAYSIEAQNPDQEEEVSGTITAIDLTLGTLTIQSSEEGGDDEPITSVTVNVTASTTVTLDDNPVYLTDLAVGDRAEVDYDPVSMNAISIDAESPEIEGTITALDSGAGTLTITDEDGIAVSLTADSSTVIYLDDDVAATLADLAVGMEADATYNAATLTALEIDASSEDDAPVQKRSSALSAPAKTRGKSHSH